MRNGVPLPTRPISAPAGRFGIGDPGAVSGTPAGEIAGLPAFPMWISPDAVNDTESPRRTTMPVGVHAFCDGTVTPPPVPPPPLPLPLPDPVSVLFGRVSAMRLMSL